jgi:hypothetical protein
MTDNRYDLKWAYCPAVSAGIMARLSGVDFQKCFADGKCPKKNGIAQPNEIVNYPI